MTINIKNNVSWTPYLGDGTAESYIVGSSRVYRTLRVIEGKFTLDSTNFPCGASSLTYKANIRTYNEGFPQNSITAYAIIGTSKEQYKNTCYDTLSEEDKNKCFQIVQDFKNETTQSTDEIKIEFNFEPNITYYIFLIPKNNEYGLLAFNECTKFEVEPITSFTLTINPDGGEMIEYYNSSTNPSEITNTKTSFEVEFLYNNYRYLGNYVKNFYSLTNNTIGQPNNKTGYTFNGWEVTSGGGTVQKYDASSGIKGYTTDDFDELKIPQTFSYYLYDGKYAGDATVTAQWIANIYTLTIDPNGGTMRNGPEETTSSFTTQFKYGFKTYIGNLNDGTIPSNIPTRDGYEFKDFSFSQGTGKISEEEEVFYFNGGGGSGYGYSSLSGYWIFNGDYAGNVKATAQWEANQYTITFDAKGGSVSQTKKSVTYNSTYGNLPTPTRTGYTFNGWYDSNENKISSDSTVNIASNHTLTYKDL